METQTAQRHGTTTAFVRLSRASLYPSTRFDLASQHILNEYHMAHSRRFDAVSGKIERPMQDFEACEYFFKRLGTDALRVLYPSGRNIRLKFDRLVFRSVLFFP